MDNSLESWGVLNFNYNLNFKPKSVPVIKNLENNAHSDTHLIKQLNENLFNYCFMSKYNYVWQNSVSESALRNNFMFSAPLILMKLLKDNSKVIHNSEPHKTFIDDKKSFYFILKSSAEGIPDYEQPFVRYIDGIEESAIPIYSKFTTLSNWIDYHMPWQSDKEVDYLHTDNYTVFLVSSNVETQENLNIQVCNLHQGKTQKSLVNENIVYVIGSNFTLNGVDYTPEMVMTPQPPAVIEIDGTTMKFEKPAVKNLKIFYNLDKIDISTSGFVNIIYFEKK